jgi:hypothetical protein
MSMARHVEPLYCEITNGITADAFEHPGPDDVGLFDGGEQLRRAGPGASNRWMRRPSSTFIRSFRTDADRRQVDDATRRRPIVDQ